MTITISHLNPVKVLAFPGQVVSMAKIPCSNYNHFRYNNYNDHHHHIQSSSVYSRPLTMVASSKRKQFSYSTGLQQEEEDIDILPVSYDRIGGSSQSLSSHSCSCCNCQNNNTPSVHIHIVFPYSLQFPASLAVTILGSFFSKLHQFLNQLLMFTQCGSVFFFQVAVLDKDRAFRRKLKKIAENADTYGLNYILKEVVKALLQYNDSSIHFTKLCTRYGSVMGLNKDFQEFLDRELHRHGDDESLLVNSGDNVKYKNKASMVKAHSSTENEYTVVTMLLLATRGHSIPYFKEKGRSCHDSFEVLQTLQRIPENEIQSLEVLWSPRKEDEVLLEDKLLRDFPRLVRIEKGLIYMNLLS